MKNLIILLSILVTNLAFGQRDDGNKFSVKIKFDKDIPVKELQVYYTEADYTNNNSFKNVNYRVHPETNEIELVGENFWIAGNNSNFPLVVFSHSEKNKYNSNELNEERLKRTFYYLMNDNYSFDEDFNKEILFRPYHRRVPYTLRIDKDYKVNYDTETKIFLSSLIEINSL